MTVPPSMEQVERLLMREDPEYFRQIDKEKLHDAIIEAIRSSKLLPVIGREHSLEEMDRIREDVARLKRGEKPLDSPKSAESSSPNMIGGFVSGRGGTQMPLYLA